MMLAYVFLIIDIECAEFHRSANIRAAGIAYLVIA